MADSETVTFLRLPAKNTFGNRPAGEPQQWDVPGFQVAPGPSRELLDAANQVDTDATLYGPPVSAINEIVPGGVLPDDRARVRGDVYQVVGRVQDWGSAGSVIVLRRVTG